MFSSIPDWNYMQKTSSRKERRIRSVGADLGEMPQSVGQKTQFMGGRSNSNTKQKIQ
jgi:hypothetical protein